MKNEWIQNYNSYLCNSCPPLDFNKILTLKNDKALSFYSLNRIFALSLNKISGISG